MCCHSYDQVHASEKPSIGALEGFKVKHGSDTFRNYRYARLHCASGTSKDRRLKGRGFGHKHTCSKHAHTHTHTHAADSGFLFSFTRFFVWRPAAHIWAAARVQLIRHSEAAEAHAKVTAWCSASEAFHACITKRLYNSWKPILAGCLQKRFNWHRACQRPQENLSHRSTQENRLRGWRLSFETTLGTG